MADKEVMIRCSFSRKLLKRPYVHLGGDIGRLTAGIEINNGRVSEITAERAMLQGEQDRIAEYLRTAKPEPESEPKKPEGAGT